MNDIAMACFDQGSIAGQVTLIDRDYSNSESDILLDTVVTVV